MVDEEWSCGLITETQKASGAERVFSECKRRGVTLFIEDGRIAYKPKARMTKGLLYNIKQGKEELLRLLQGDTLDNALQPDSGVEEAPPPDIRVPDVGDMIPAPVIDLFGRRVKSEEKSYIEAEVYELLLEMSRQGVSLRCSRQTEDRLVASPGNALSSELIEGIKEHKTQIIQAMQDHELLKSGVVQCERQAFELAREEFKGAS